MSANFFLLKHVHILPWRMPEFEFQKCRPKKIQSIQTEKGGYLQRNKTQGDLRLCNIKHKQTVEPGHES